MPKPLTRLETLRGMRISTVEGIVATWWFAIITGAIPQGLALYLGASPFVIGLLGSLQAVAGLASLVGAYVGERQPERRGYAVLLLGGGRALWFLVAVATVALSHRAALGVLLLVVGVSWTMINLASPAWTSWMNDLVPSGMRGRFFSRRSLLIGLFSIVAAPLAGRFVDVGEASIGPVVTFAILFGVAGILGVADGYALLRQPEPPVRVKEPPRLDREYFLAPLRDRPFARFLTVFALWAFSQSVAGPFFTVYMLEKLHLSFFQVQMLNALAAMVTLAVTPSVGFLIDKYGNKPIYVIAYTVVTTLPLFWAATRPDRPWLTAGLIIAVQALSGMCGAALGLTQFNLLLGLSPSERTAQYSAVWGTVVGAAGFVGPLLGGAIASAAQSVNIHAGGWDIGPYKITFFVSTALRMMVLPLLSGLSEKESAEVREVLGRVAMSKPLRSVRHMRRLRGPATASKRAKSARALGQMREYLAFEELVEALQDPVLAVRRQAAIALGELGDPRALEPLLEALCDQAAGIRTQAAVALGKLGDDRAVDALIDILQGGGARDSAFVQAAAQALGRLRAVRASAPLLEIAEEPENPARAAAIQSLGDLGEESVAEPLAEMLRSDENLEPQEVSALGDALAKLGEESAVIPLLERMAEADSPLMRRELATHAGDLIGRAGELYAWLALDEFAREAALAQMLNGHAREMRRLGRASAALRAEAAVEAFGANDSARTLRHLLVGVHKSGHTADGAPADALEWLASRSRVRKIGAEEILVALYAYHVLLRRPEEP